MPGVDSISIAPGYEVVEREIPQRGQSGSNEIGDQIVPFVVVHKIRQYTEVDEQTGN